MMLVQIGAGQIRRPSVRPLPRNEIPEVQMKAVLIPLVVAAGVFSAGLAQAGPEDVAKAQCGKCHELEKKKKGPPYLETAKKFKGKADAEATMIKEINDRTGDHPEIKASQEDIKTVVQWILTL